MDESVAVMDDESVTDPESVGVGGGVIVSEVLNVTDWLFDDDRVAVLDGEPRLGEIVRLFVPEIDLVLVADEDASEESVLDDDLLSELVIVGVPRVSEAVGDTVGENVSVCDSVDVEDCVEELLNVSDIVRENVAVNEMEIVVEIVLVSDSDVEVDDDNVGVGGGVIVSVNDDEVLGVSVIDDVAVEVSVRDDVVVIVRDRVSLGLSVADGEAVPLVRL